MCAKKITFKDLKCRGISRTGRKRNQFDVSLSELASLSLKNDTFPQDNQPVKLNHNTRVRIFELLVLT